MSRLPGLAPPFFFPSRGVKAGWVLPSTNRPLIPSAGIFSPIAFFPSCAFPSVLPCDHFAPARRIFLAPACLFFQQNSLLCHVVQTHAPSVLHFPSCRHCNLNLHIVPVGRAAFPRVMESPQRFLLKGVFDFLCAMYASLTLGYPQPLDSCCLTFDHSQNL